MNGTWVLSASIVNLQIVDYILLVPLGGRMDKITWVLPASMVTVYVILRVRNRRFHILELCFEKSIGKHG